MSMHINFNQLYAFFLTVQYGSMAVAAEKLHVSPPAVTMHIKRLERQLGCKLFYRSAKQLSLTPCAKTLYAQVTQFFSHANELNNYLATLIDEQNNELLLGTHHIPAQYILPKILRHVRISAPKLRVRMVLGTQEQSMHSLLTEEVQMALVAEEEPHPHVSLHFLFNDELILATAGNSSLANKETISVQELNHIDLAWQINGGALVRIQRHYFAQHGVTPRIAIDGLSSEVIKRMLPGTECAAFFTRYSITEDLQAGTLREIHIAEGPPAWPIQLAYLTKNAQLLTVTTFLHALRNLAI